ncbi:hypothetical protein Bca52824_095192 [Brassica carinata]|uniref:Uncharacterized protein n=1 Tax=Brassica carinata TaxID=52824 RepID=A0A8X7P2J2_BRACI|nr:hypothetical protein Bca52824_095192 [Brassica carinata]
MVDLLADAEGISVNTVNFKALFGRGLIGHVLVMLAKPQTLMDASDESFCTLFQIYEDLALPFGTLRLLPKGGHGGHNGRPPKKMDTANYILSQFSEEEHEQLDNIFRTGLKGIRMLLFEGVSDSGTFVNTPKD